MEKRKLAGFRSERGTGKMNRWWTNAKEKTKGKSRQCQHDQTLHTARGMSVSVWERGHVLAHFFFFFSQCKESTQHLSFLLPLAHFSPDVLQDSQEKQKQQKIYRNVLKETYYGACVIQRPRSLRYDICKLQPQESRGVIPSECKAWEQVEDSRSTRTRGSQDYSAQEKRELPSKTNSSKNWVNGLGWGQFCYRSLSVQMLTSSRNTQK